VTGAQGPAPAVSAGEPAGRPLRVPAHVVRAVALSGLATVLVGVPVLLGGRLYSEEQAVLLLAVHFVALTIPTAHLLGAYEKHRDFFHPSFIAAFTFIVFQLVLNPVIYGDALVLTYRKLDGTSSTLRTETVIHSYAVVTAAWIAYAAGCRLLPGWRAGAQAAWARPSTRLFLVVGIAFVLVGVLGNLGVIGSVGSYLVKMTRPWERWAEWEEAGQEGGTKWAIMMRFLPVGLLVLAYGLYLRRQGRPALLYALVIAASLANVVLSSATGGRGTMLLTAFYGIVLVNHSARRLSFHTLVLTFLGLTAVAFVMGQLRAAAYYQTTATFSGVDAFLRFLSMYLSNYLGTLTLVFFVEQEGITHGSTAWAGLTGLLGGPTPLTTQAEVWYRLTGFRSSINPRYGPPGELYFNYGWLGLIVGMLLIGLTVQLLARRYDAAREDRSVAGGLLAVFAAFTANFVMIGNLSYLPPYFTYYSLPFYLVFWLFRRRLC